MTEEQILEQFESIRKHFHDGDLNAVKMEYSSFSKNAISFLEQQNQKLSELNKQDSILADNISMQLIKLQSFAEETSRLEEEDSELQKEFNVIEEQIRGIESKISDAYKQINSAKFINEADPIIKQINKYSHEIPKYEEHIQKYQNEFLKADSELKALKKTLAEREEHKTATLRKNQNRKVELEARMHRASSNASILESQQIKAEEEAINEISKPSLIIHRTADSDAEIVRKLKIRLEQAILENTKSKAKLTSLTQDLDALHDEAMVLKSLARTNSPDNIQKK